jgi:hypothetical protein
MAHRRGHKIMSVKGEFKALGVFLIMALFLALIPSEGQAAVTLPDVQQLTGIAMTKSALWAPGRLAIGGDGTLFVVDSYNNRILKLGSNGNSIGDIPFPRVSAIAVAPDGTLYIGSHQDYSVSIVKNGQVVGHLGAGQNEFLSVRDIACDPSTGLVYVADNVGSAVRIFDATGRDMGSIGGVNLPVAVEVTAEAIYVLDAPVVQDKTSTTTASRISIFDKNYTLTGTIDEPAGQHLMYRPTDLAVVNGVIYVSDAALRTVLLFDISGSYLGEIQGTDNGINTAVSVAVSSAGILYVSSSETHSIYMFALTAKSGAGVSPGGPGN